MNTLRIIPASAVVLFVLAASIASAAPQISLTDQEAEWIGDKIFQNECGGKDGYLVAWNKGEDFMSLGIGHFIWYPADKPGPFDESFPGLLKFIGQKGGDIPAWLREQEDPHCPWGSREEFLKDPEDPKIRDLRKFLAETKDLQLLFIVNRLKNALPKMLDSVPKELRLHIEQQFYRMAAAPSGMYALVDYVNFKGEGTLATERYKGQGWGLVQVLGRMDGSAKGPQAVREFVQEAGGLLTDRVDNAPPGRDERRWLPGWKNRLNTYVQ